MFKTKHQKKAFIESVIVMAILIALMFIVGLKYLDPPPPGNIAINFGFNEQGSGNVQPQKNKPVNVPNPQPVKKQPEKILTQENTDNPVIKTTKSPEKKPKQTKPAPTKPKPSKETSEVLKNIFDAPEGENNSASEGNDANTKGDKGSSQGNSNTDNYYGTGGNGGNDPNYQLGNRKAIKKPRPKFNCNEEGKVVIKITVNRAGKVISAVKDKGTTASECLTNAAIEAAKNTTWEPDPNAEPKQIGKIIYNFKLTE